MNCAFCNQTPVNLLRCSRCRNARYCSALCQRNDWPRHKSQCKAATESSTSRPSMAEDIVSSLQRCIPEGLRKDPLCFHPSKPDPQTTLNLLFVLHGLGDRPASLHRLMAKMNLPQTVAVCLTGPQPILDFGFGWFPHFDAEGEALLPMSPIRQNGLRQAERMLVEMIGNVVTRTKFSFENIFLFGFSQGGSMALHIGSTINKKLGGIVSISGPLLPETSSRILPDTQYTTPTLVTHGLRDDVVPIKEARLQYREAQSYMKQIVEWKEYPKGHELMSSPNEVRDFMDFYSKRMTIDSPSLANHPDIIDVTGERLTVEKMYTQE